MTAMIARLTALFMFLVPILVTPLPAIAGPANSRAEDAAAAAERAKNTTEKLRGNEPPVYDRRAQPAYEDALERAERREEKSSFEADNVAREAARVNRQAKKRAIRDGKIRQRLKERKKRLRREFDENAGRR